MCVRTQEGYLASAQQYAQITELSKRVADWENKIVPKLQEEVRAVNLHTDVSVASDEKPNEYNLSVVTSCTSGYNSLEIA